MRATDQLVDVSVGESSDCGVTGLRELARGARGAVERGVVLRVGVARGVAGLRGVRAFAGSETAPASAAVVDDGSVDGTIRSP